MNWKHTFYYILEAHLLSQGVLAFKIINIYSQLPFWKVCINLYINQQFIRIPVTQTKPILVLVLANNFIGKCRLAKR